MLLQVGGCLKRLLTRPTLYFSFQVNRLDVSNEILFVLSVDSLVARLTR